MYTHRASGHRIPIPARTQGRFLSGFWEASRNDDKYAVTSALCLYGPDCKYGTYTNIWTLHAVHVCMKYHHIFPLTAYVKYSLIRFWICPINDIKIFFCISMPYGICLIWAASGLAVPLRICLWALERDTITQKSWLKNTHTQTFIRADSWRSRIQTLS